MKTRYILSAILVIISSVIHSQVPSDPVQPNRKQIQLPYNRLIQPAGLQVFFGDESLENHSLDAALSPDGKWLAVEERYSVVFIRISDNNVKFTLANNDHPDLKGGMNTYSGITWYNGLDGPEVYWSVVGKNSRSFVVSARWDGMKAEFGRMLEYKEIPPAKMALPNEILIRKESDREFLYVVLNGNNRSNKTGF